MTVHALNPTSENKNLGSNYSKIISPEDYNTLMTDQHLYINAADHYIAKTIKNRLKNLDKPTIVEVGCGPARITRLVFSMNPNSFMFGLDVDSSFLEYAKKTCEDLPVNFINASIEEYKHSGAVDLFFSEGFHHHIAKNNTLDLYLNNIFSQLKKGGFYIVGDEFIAEYKTDEEREINLVLWYFHIISNALKSGFKFLAEEEAKTFLDDIYEGRVQNNIKNLEQINLVLEFSLIVEKLLKENSLDLAKEKSCDFLKKLDMIHNEMTSQNDAMDLSRGDFKISCSAFVEEVQKIGFSVEEFKAFGPLSGVGCMGVYILRKP